MGRTLRRQLCLCDVRDIDKELRTEMEAHEQKPGNKDRLEADVFFVTH